MFARRTETVTNPEKGLPAGESDEATWAHGRAEPFSGIKRNITPGGRSSGLMKQVVARENMLAALKRVERNGGAPGVDGI